MIITRTSPFSEQTTQRDLKITAEQLVHWLTGDPAGKIWPFLPKGDREFIMTGITEQEWDTDAAAWGITEFVPEEMEGTIVLLDEYEVKEVLQLIAIYNPVKPIRTLNFSV